MGILWNIFSVWRLVNYRLVTSRATRFNGSNADWSPIFWTFRQDPVRARMVLVPDGCFNMGSDSGGVHEQPTHEQCVSAFWLDQTEVTRNMYHQCMLAEACPLKPINDYAMQSDQPVNYIYRYTAKLFCRWRGLRLPSEVEIRTRNPRETQPS